MSPSKAFIELWLRADTYIDHLQAWQIQRVRGLCQRFFEKGREYERRRRGMLSSVPNQPYTEEENDRRQS